MLNAEASWDTMPLMKTLRVGIVGAGAIVRDRHAPGLAALPEVEIVAVANSTTESARHFVENRGLNAGVVADWRELVSRLDLDIVWIGAGPFLHEPVTLAALEAGHHVFCQARMSTDLASARRMLEAAQKRPDLVTMLCPPPHGLREDAFVKKLLADGCVGTVHSLRLRSWNGAFRDPAQPLHWRQRPEISGKNILTLGIHTEVLQRWFGSFHVCAAAGRVLVPQHAGQSVTVPDELVVIAAWESGPAGVLDFSGVHAGPAEDCLMILGSDGVLKVDYLSGAITRQSPGREPEILLPPDDLIRPWQVEADFIHAVRNPEAPRPRPDFADGVAYMEVVEEVSGLLETSLLKN
ncbi:MAG: hypothetical protein Fur0032_02170 [Terrimicrobiaceae bacterium]